jgi:regulator of protease activity HflC (stomatin/prohibitin superfamily)
MTARTQEPLMMPTRYRNESQDLQKTAVVRDAVLAAVALVLALAFWPLRTVPTGHRGVITVGGAIRSIEAEGFLLVWPWQRLDIFNIRAEQADINDAEGPTSDQQPVKASLTVRYSISPDKVAEVFEKYSRDGDLTSYVQTATQEVFKAVTVRYTAPELIAKRAAVSGDIATALRNKLALYGAQVINIDMRNFSFAAAYVAAINDKVTQEQLRQAADNKLKTVESEQKQKVAVAEAEASAQRARADGEAYAALKIATAQAEALRVQNAALAQNRDVLELRRIEVEMAKAQKWNGALPQNVYAGAPIPFFNPSGAK